MRLRTKLVLTATGLTFAIVLVISVVFLGELLRQRVQQTATANEAQAHLILLMTQDAVVNGLKAHPPQSVASPDAAEDSLHAAVVDALRSSDALMAAMNGVVRYSPTVEDVSVTDSHGFTIVSTDPDAVNQRAPYRENFARVRDGSAFYQMREVFGKPRVLDVAAPLERNRMPFLVVHLGVRSTFLRSVYAPWLYTALEFVLLATLASVAIAALLSTVALRPLQAIGAQLERLARTRGEDAGDALAGGSAMQLEIPLRRGDPVGLVNRTIDRLGRQMRTQEEGYTALQTNLNRMLDTLRDGVLLFAADGRAVMVSDAVANFVRNDRSLPSSVAAMVGCRLEQIFDPGTALGAALSAAFARGGRISAETVTLEDGRQVKISLDRIGDPAAGDMGTLLTLRDTGSALELEREIEVARRLAAIGRLTANVGHEVKNPINAMVVHLELLRGKLEGSAFDRGGAQKHVDILTDEMHRLDRVVQTLADFSRPMDLDLREQDLRRVVEQTLDLAGAELKENGVEVDAETDKVTVPVLVDAELMRQAVLNLLLNAMQAMPSGGVVRVSVRRELRLATVQIADNGPGIPPALLPRIFDLYFTTKPTGSGIGLAMAYRILQLHGGTLEVRSNAEPDSPERGTTFSLHLPISLSAGHESRKPAARLAGGTQAADDNSPALTTTMERRESL